jgi:hypothetical protein
LLGDPGHHGALLLSAALSLSACNEFPCADEQSVHDIEPVALDADEIRYSYWLGDASQHVVFDADEIPETARHAVLAHVGGETTPQLHGAIGWVADLTADAPSARLRPMAVARARALAAWSGRWSGDWARIRAEVLAIRRQEEEEAETKQAAPLEAEEEQSSEADPLDKLQADLAEQGITMDEVRLERALRSVGVRRPSPRDFGLSVDLHPNWLFVEDGCEACTRAVDALDDAHVLRISDPSNARTLRQLSKLAGVEPVVPTIWHGDSLRRGWNSDTAKDPETR